MSAVAVIFFGIGRSLPLTSETIHRNLSDLAANSSVDRTAIASLNLIDVIHNPRSGEFNIAVDPSENFLLRADHYLLSRQVDPAIDHPLRAAQTKGDRFHNEWSSVRNLLHQLASLQRGWRCSEAMPGKEFDYFLFLRPDLAYLDEINLPDLIEAVDGPDGIALPAWHSNRGLNDRMAFAGRDAAMAYANRIDLVPEYCAERSLHPERLVAYTLARSGCRICEMPVRARRVRANGDPRRDGFGSSVAPLPRRAAPFWYTPERGLFFEEKEFMAPIQLIRLSEHRAAAPRKEEGAVPVAEPPAGPGVAVGEVIRIRQEPGPEGLVRASRLEGMRYLEYLDRLHQSRQVKRYLEIGTQKGKSLRYARERAISIDPAYRIDVAAWGRKPGMHLFEMTSDDFFALHDPARILGGPIEMAFIDGMHLSDFVLRDFINVERYSSPDGAIILHDAIPMNFEVAERDRRPKERQDRELARAWTGDVWRVLPILRELRPDLKIEVLDCPPTGLVVVTNLDPRSTRLAEREAELMDRLTASEPSEAEFWAFLENLPVVRT